MPTTRVYKDVKIYSGGYDISGALNELELSYEFDEVEVKHYGQQCRYAVPGLPKLAFNLQGNAYSSATPAGVEDVLRGRIAQGDVPMTFCPLTGAAGEAGYFAKTLELSYKAGAAVGEMYVFTAAGVGENVPLLRGTVMENGAKTTTGSGTARQLGAVSSVQKLYACLHVIDVSGATPTLDLIIESDDAEGFASPVTRATFAQASAIGAQYPTPVDGPITDTWWRAKWTIGGSGSPSFTIALCVGIQ